MDSDSGFGFTNERFVLLLCRASVPRMSMPKFGYTPSYVRYLERLPEHLTAVPVTKGGMKRLRRIVVVEGNEESAARLL